LRSGVRRDCRKALIAGTFHCPACLDECRSRQRHRRGSTALPRPLIGSRRSRRPLRAITYQSRYCSRSPTTSRLWEQHAGQPSDSGAYGVMALTTLPRVGEGRRRRGTGVAAHAPRRSRAGEGQRERGQDERRHQHPGRRRAARELRQAARRWPATGRSRRLVRRGRRLRPDEQCDRGRRRSPMTSTDHPGGASRTTADGQTVTLAADPGARPIRRRGTAAAGDAGGQSAHRMPTQPRLRFRNRPPTHQTNPKDPTTNYGNYDIANRPKTMKG